jgi:hypothetical protein
VLVGCVALLILAPTALAVESTGKISGTVTEAMSKKGLGNIEVTVYEASGKESPVGFATTEANGVYTTVEGLPEGEYKVEFSGFESNQNFITQFYENQSSLAAAKHVKVITGKTTEKIDAEMQVGGEISGTVTDAVTHAAVPNVVIFALGAGEILDGFAATNGSGQYTMVGLATNSYKIEFLSGKYVTQYYNEQPSFASANPASVMQGSTALGINAMLMPKAPINTVAPVASGTPAVGQTLSCTSGSWTGTPRPTFAYSWLRDGVAIAGATGTTYVVQAADQGNGLTCKVTATNKSGSVAALSNTLIVPVPPPPPPPKPLLTLLSSKVVVSSGSARVPISCANSTCAGTIELTEQVVFRPRHGRLKKKTLVLGKSSYALAVGHSATILVHLTGAVKNVLAVAKHHRLPAKVSVTVIGGATVSRSILLSEKPKKHKRRHR